MQSNYPKLKNMIYKQGKTIYEFLFNTNFGFFTLDLRGACNTPSDINSSYLFPLQALCALDLPPVVVSALPFHHRWFAFLLGVAFVLA